MSDSFASTQAERKRSEEGSSLRSFVSERRLDGKVVLYVVNYIDYFLSHRKHIALATQARGARVVVASPDTELAHRVEALGFRHITIPLARWGLNPLQDLVTLRSLVRLYKGQAPDVVHHITIKPVIYGGIAARLAKVPAVVHSISGLGYVFYAEGIRARLRRVLVKTLYRLALRNPQQRLIIQNQDNRAYFVESKLIKEEDTTVIPGAGVDTERFFVAEEPEGEPLILFVARLQWAKGIREFCEVAGAFAKEGVPGRFLLAGGFDFGSPDGLTESEAARLGQEYPVTFLGERQDVDRLLQQSHIACLPSYSEGMPKSLIEAASSGRAIVATDIAGCRAIVEHGYNGLLVQPRDTESLAAALKALVMDTSTRLEMGRNGRRFVEEHGLSEQRVAEATLDTYQDLLAAHENQRSTKMGTGRPSQSDRLSR